MSEDAVTDDEKKRKGPQNNAASLGAHGREDAHKFYPWELTIVVGKDVAPDVKMLADAGHLTLLVDETHSIFQLRANRPVKESTIASIAPKALGGEGQIHNIKIWRDGPQKLVLVGRGRNKAIAMRNYRLCEKTGKTKEQLLDQMQKVAATVHQGDEGSAWRVMTAENEERDDSTLLEKLLDAQKGIEIGVPEKEVARLQRVDVPTLKLKLKFLDLAPEVQQAIMSGEMPESMGYLEFVKWTRKEQVVHLNEMREAGALKGQAAKVAIEEIKKGKKPTRSTEPVKRAPSKKKVRVWIEVLKDCSEKDKYAAGMRAAFMKMLGGKPRGIPDHLKELLGDE
jgi:hypothetical protein